MKKKILSLLVLLAAAASGAWADETTTVTWGTTQLASIGNLTVGESKTVEGITITVLEGSDPTAQLNKNRTFYYSDMSVMQFFGNKGTNDFQFTSTIGNITKIEMASMNQPAAGDGWSNGVWTGNASTVYFGGSVATQQVVFTIEKAPFDYEFTDVASDHGSGQVKFFIGSKEVEGAYEADEGKTVTVTVAPDEGWVVDPFAVTAEVYRYWEGSRRAQAMIPMQRTVDLTYVSTDANGVATYTFVMPASNVRVAPKYLKSSTLYFDPAGKTNLMEVKVGTTVRNVEDSKTVKIEKVEKVTEGTPVKLTANTGYKFRKVEVKKGGGTKILTIGTRQLTYVEGETWKDAIDNHPTENTGWMYYNSDVYHGSNKLYYSGWNSLDANTAVDSSKSYIFYE
jgi:hypothetical protein